jgi:hypothetical protein
MLGSGTISPGVSVFRWGEVVSSDFKVFGTGEFSFGRVVRLGIRFLGFCFSAITVVPFETELFTAVDTASPARWAAMYLSASSLLSKLFHWAPG